MSSCRESDVSTFRFSRVMAVPAVLAASAAFAANGFTVVPRLETGHLSYNGEYKLTYPGGFSVKNGLTISSPLIRPGLTLAKGPFYLDAYWQTIAQDTDTFGAVPGAERFDGRRDEYVVGLGYAITPQLSAVAGVRSSRADLDGKLGGERFDLGL